MKLYGQEKQFIKDVYGKQYHMWKGKYCDDRSTYCAIYEMLLEALESIKDVKEDNLIWSAFIMMLHVKTNTLDNIKERFNHEGGE